MLDNNVFKTAFNVFLQEGRFEFSHSKLSLNQLQGIKNHLKYASITSDIPFYEICLNNVEFVPFHIEELIEIKTSEDIVLSGDLTEQELPASLRGKFELYSEDKDLCILNYMERIEYPKRRKYEDAIETIENTLLSLFETAKWKVIKLENVRIVGEENNKHLNFQFIYNLYNILSPYANQIKELSLKKVDLFNTDAFEIFLRQASQLEILRLEDVQIKNKSFQSASNVFLKHLCEGLINHSTLKKLDLGDMALKEADYLELFKLLDKNYQLDQIFLKSPSTFGNLNYLHHKLIREMKERAKKSSLERFQEKQLTPYNLSKLAELSLESKFHPLKLSLNSNTKKLVFTHPINKGLPENLIQKLPEGFRKYPDLLQQSWPIELDISQHLDNQVTLGAHLLEKAFQLGDPQYVELFLSAGADLLEKLPGKPSLVERIFSNKENVCKEIMINYVKKDLAFFVPLIWRFYTSHDKLSNKLGSIKHQLDDFLTKLLNLDQLPFLLKIFRRIGLDGKKENWEKDLRLVVQAARAGSKEYPINDSALEEFQKIISYLLKEVERDKQRRFRDHKFNQALSAELTKLLSFTEDYRKLFELEEKNIKLQEQLKRSQETIEEMKIKHKQDLAEQKTEFEIARVKDKADMEAKRAQDKIGIRTEIRAEFEAKRARDKADTDTQINELRSLFESRQQAYSSSDTQAQEKCMRFFKS